MRGARSGGPRWVLVRAAGDLCLAGLMIAAFAILESRSCARLLLHARGRALVDRHAHLLQGHRDVGDAGRLAAAVGAPARRSSRAPCCSSRAARSARSCRTRPRCSAVVAAFFLLLMVGWENPFDTLPPRRRRRGLNPLLRHPAMMIHPPMLYTGYVGVLDAVRVRDRRLITRQTGADWIRATRRFALIAWTFLGSAIMLGALWSYAELGWGGYWAWDPVENASLMPWLDGHRVHLHSIMVQEKRGMLKIWNVSLVMRHLRARAARHVPGAVRDPRLDPRLRRLDARQAVPDLHRASWSRRPRLV